LPVPEALQMVAQTGKIKNQTKVYENLHIFFITKKQENPLEKRS
jgi:hypothetical protein